MKTGLSCILVAVALYCCGCGGERPGTAATEAPVKGGCYLGDGAEGGDSVFVQLEASQGAQLQGRMVVAIPEKDRRSGTIRGIKGADGTVRASYRFMQEGVTDSVRVQFRQDREGNSLQLRPSAYDPETGREYPDSSKTFSIILKPVPCR